MRLSNSVSGVLRIFSHFMASVFAIVFAAALHAPAYANDSSDQLAARAVKHSKGAVEYSIPDSWFEVKEEIPENDDSFIDGVDQTSVFRLYALDLHFDEPATKMAKEILPPKSYQMIGNGIPLHRHVKSSIVAGQEHLVYRWDFAVPQPPNSVRLVKFSYRVPAARVEEPRV